MLQASKQNLLIVLGFPMISILSISDLLGLCLKWMSLVTNRYNQSFPHSLFPGCSVWISFMFLGRTNRTDARYMRSMGNNLSPGTVKNFAFGARSKMWFFV